MYNIKITMIVCDCDYSCKSKRLCNISIIYNCEWGADDNDITVNEDFKQYKDDANCNY